MPLPSQSARPINRRSHMYRRTRGRRRRITLAVVLGVVALGGLWWFWPDGSDGAQESTTQAENPGPAGTADRSQRQRLATAPERSPATNQPMRNPGTDQSAQAPQKPPIAAATTTLVMGQPIPDQPQESSIVAPPADQQTGPEITRPKSTQSLPDNANGRSESTAAPNDSRPVNRAAAPPGTSSAAVLRLIADGKALLQSRPVDARLLLSRALGDAGISAGDAAGVRQTLTTLNDTLVFGSAIVSGDPYVLSYNIQERDTLQKIVRTKSLQIDWRLLERINGVDARRIRTGQRLKLITGPFHAVVHKNDFRLDLYLGDGDQQVFVRSLSVGLGQYNSTPEGLFRVGPGAKAVNPAWTNPRTGEQFDANNPQNPIGDYWIGLEGVDPSLRDVRGYGIHGTIEPQSIGQEMSMGCIRLRDDDIRLIYEVLVEEASLVRIMP